MSLAARYTEIVMGASMQFIKSAVAAFLTMACLAGTVHAQGTAPGSEEPSLTDQLQVASPEDAARLEREIRMDWEKSGSPAMDLLLKRGKDALEAGELELAIGHLSALTDHAPDFAEGWHARAMAFYQEEEFGLALHDLEVTLALNPRHFAAIYGRGVVMESLGRDTDAYALYTRVLSLHPHHQDALEGVERLKARVNGTEI